MTTPTFRTLEPGPAHHPECVFDVSFDLHKVAHAAAFLVLRASGALDGVRLFALLCAADEEYRARFGGGMFDRRFFRSEDEPPEMLTLCRLRDAASRPEWDAVLARSGDGRHVVRPGVGEDRLDLMSPADECCLIHALDGARAA